jgi:hypothetical protein
VEAYYGADTVRGPLWEFTTGYPSSVDVFGFFEIDARQAPSGYHVMEEFRARFDTGTAVTAPIEPLQADSVKVAGAWLDWSAIAESYDYTEWSMPSIENGQPVAIEVFGNAEVPNLNANPVFPACTLSVTEPESFETVSIDGFEVRWDRGSCGGTVWLTLLYGNDSTGVWKEVANDGVDSLTAADLAPLGGQTGQYDLAVVKLVEENVVASGYRATSLVRFRAYNVMAQIRLQ